MLRPTKHLNLPQCLLSVSAKMLRLLEKRRMMHHGELYDELNKRVGSSVQELFVPAVSFLFLLGRLEYHSQTDSFEYVEPLRGEIRP